MIPAWYKDETGTWVKVKIVAFLSGPNRGYPCVVMYAEADKTKTYSCVAMYEEGTRASRFRDR